MSENLSSWFAVERKYIAGSTKLEPTHLLVLLVLVERARYNGNRINKGTGLPLEMGQLCFGYEELGKACQISKDRAKTAVKTLLLSGLLIHLRSTYKGSTVFIGEMRWISSIASPPTPPLPHQSSNTNLQVPLQEQEQGKNVGLAPSLPLLVDKELCKQAMGHLNLRRGSKYQPVGKNLENIRVLAKQGFGLRDFKLVTEYLIKTWGDDPKMDQHICPTTIFRPSKFIAKYHPEAESWLELMEKTYGPFPELAKT